MIFYLLWVRCGFVHILKIVSGLFTVLLILKKRYQPGRWRHCVPLFCISLSPDAFIFFRECFQIILNRCKHSLLAVHRIVIFCNKIQWVTVTIRISFICLKVSLTHTIYAWICLQCIANTEPNRTAEYWLCVNGQWTLNSNLTHRLYKDFNCVIQAHAISICMRLWIFWPNLYLYLLDREIQFQYNLSKKTND